MSSVTPSRPVLAGKFTARPEITIGSRWGTMSTTSGAVPTRNSYCIANDSLDVAVSTWDCPGSTSWLGARQGTLLSAGHGAPSIATYFATLAAWTGSLRNVCDTNVPRECPTRYTWSTPNSASVASTTSVSPAA